MIDPFPCWETPAKCFLHSPNHNRQIGCTREGAILVSENRKEWEEWLIFPRKENQGDDNIACYIKSNDHGGLFLASAPEGGGISVVTESSDWNKVWYVFHLKTGDHEGGWLIRSEQTNRYLACDGNNAYTVDHVPRGWETWNIELVTGEQYLEQSKLNHEIVSSESNEKIIHPVVFPCWEIPAKCFLHSPNHNRQIGCTREGSIFLTENRKGWEEWLIFPLEENQSDGRIACHIKSSDHGGLFLASDPEGGGVSAVTESTDLNIVWYVNHMKTGDHEGRWLIQSKQTNRYLACDGNNSYTVDHEPRGWETWNIEFATGELCLIQSKLNNRFVSCNPQGNLCMKHNSDGWEVWRFIRLWDKHGSFLIASWTHTPKCLASCSSGNVWSSNNRQGEWERWTMEKAPDSSGVVIRSLSHKRALCINVQGHLYTSAEATTNGSLWDIQAANKNIFCITKGDLLLADSDNEFEVAKQASKSTYWEIKVHEESGEISLKNCRGLWLSVNKQDKLCQINEPVENWPKWEVAYAPSGGVTLMSIDANKYLTCNGNSFSLSEHCDDQEAIVLRPVLPHTISGSQMQAVTGAAIGSIALIIAAPFAIMGVIGALGFGGGGIAAGSFAAGMMSAEAIAAGGGVVAGGLVATLQSIGAAGLGILGTSVALGGGAIIGGTVFGSTIIASGIFNQERASLNTQDEINLNSMQNRPFCAWKSW